MSDKMSRQIKALGGNSDMEVNLNILIIDDELDFVECIQGALQSRSCQVVTVATKKDAQDSVSATLPDVIVIGTIMPRGDAFALHRWVKGNPQLNSIPMIVVDAPPEKRVIKGWRRDEGLRLEADDYLVKPVEPEALVFLIEKLADRETAKIRVLVVDDQAVVRDAIRALIGLQKDMVVVGEAADGKDAVDKVKLYKPDIVLMDIVMPVMNGLKATEIIHDEREDTKVLMLSQYDNDENVRESNKVGACGFVSKSSADTELISAIRSA